VDYIPIQNIEGSRHILALLWPETGFWEGSSEWIVGNPYLGITSGLPVTRPAFVQAISSFL
jgi:hypothetical protein